MKKKFNSISLAALLVNYMVGFGFIATIMKIVNLGPWGILVISLTLFVAIATALVFTRLSNNFHEEDGGSMYFAKQTGKESFAFYIGFNQYAQYPLFSASGPLFLVTAAETLTSNNIVLWIVRIFSIMFFIFLAFVSTSKLKTSKFIIFGAAIVKWIILFIGFSILLYLATKFNYYSYNFTHYQDVNTYLILSNSLSFMFAFSGIEIMPSFAKESKVRNYKKVFIILFGTVLFIYFIGYVLFLGTKISIFDGKFVNIYTQVHHYGSILFIIFLIFYNVSDTLTSQLAYSRTLSYFAKQGYLPKKIALENENGEHKNDIWLNTIIILTFMTFFVLLPEILKALGVKIEKDYFNSFLDLGTMTYLIQYVGSFITLLLLEQQKKVRKIALIEKMFYFVAIFILVSMILVRLFPFLADGPWKVSNWISLFTFILIHIIIFTLIYLKKQRNKKEILAKANN
ncbi:hypothetical protein VO56_00235 [Mycoplasmopsis gallinacea]|uniref:Amino acid permease n=1 Tax=Mycoplasmopsis gallinacea TaxID=29556 RepID=A0A0D5ZIF8_9BACT|nr:hypothetical protein VO56_00235 [Mycoplasmopsis gallinacea]